MVRKRSVAEAEPQPQPEPEPELEPDPDPVSVDLPEAVLEPPADGDMEPVVGRVKWFDATRGFGFIVSDTLEGDILVHFSVLREHG